MERPVQQEMAPPNAPRVSQPFNLAKQPLLAHTWGVVVGRPDDKIQVATTTTTTPEPIRHDSFAETIRNKLADQSAQALAKQKQRESQMSAMWAMKDGQVAGPPLPAGMQLPPHVDETAPVQTTTPPNVPFVPSGAGPQAGGPTTITMMSHDGGGGDKIAAQRSASAPSCRGIRELGIVLILAAALP